MYLNHHTKWNASLAIIRLPCMPTELIQFGVVKRGNRIADNNENGKCLWGHF